LATFLGRFWSTPNRLLTAFPIDRRELADHVALGLTEARVRGAIRTLEEAGFLDRAVASGSTHKPTPNGLRRKPVLFMFGAELWPAVQRGQQTGCGGPRAAFGRARPSTNVLKARPLNSPKYKDSEAAKVIMGEIRASPPPISLNPNLEAALERWKKAAEGQGLLRSDQQDSQCSRQRPPPTNNSYKNQRARRLEPLLLPTGGRQVQQRSRA